MDYLVTNELATKFDFREDGGYGVMDYADGELCLVDLPHDQLLGHTPLWWHLPLRASCFRLLTQTDEGKSPLHFVTSRNVVFQIAMVSAEMRGEAERWIQDMNERIAKMENPDRSASAE